MNKIIPSILFSIFSLTTLSAQEIKINPDRLHQSLITLATFGKNAQGGSDRVAYSKYDMEAREYVKGLMEEAGMEVSVDFAGNIIGRKQGRNPNLKPIAFGSHIDEVPNGGDYDGPVGSMSAIEVVKTLSERRLFTDHPLEVIIFPNEEGGVIGSRALVGSLSKDALQVTSSSGLTQYEGIKLLGGNPDRIQEVKRNPGDLTAFLELHIEQGGNLDRENLDIGVVEGIVAIEWWEFTFKGKANHAGTTPMNMRNDPMLPAASFILAVNETVKSYEGRQVGTVGKIQAFPGAGNVIPGEVKLNLELRDLSSEKIWMIYQALEKKAKELASASQTEISIQHIDVASTPAIADSKIREVIKTEAEKLGFSTKSLPSGAGHDAQEMARIAPMGMIFIPSKNGISHAPEEFSSKQDIANGANVLLGTILALDRLYTK
ncbi:N-carbamoyl-L-amino-acid hydrolase [Algoriphagus boseongensis]|uniref:N-carbamoyl-L-amino-acid hydrolase n=1 Tax=Algoriphagus boseongensis TaxID=1442587 RepID=A0A4R6T657_9BACT|nr:Zn-dependent hydrolase [Algoriphagus boseongensis]TDQ17519.1 N-carbamoyl-L-amino-acid hydrolase [Algoriphagus boseongensis]